MAHRPHRPSRDLRAPAIGAVLGFAVLAGCGGGDGGSAAPSTTTAAAPTTTTAGASSTSTGFANRDADRAGTTGGSSRAAALARARTAMLTAADVGPGYTSTPSTPDEDDTLSKCMPDNPLATTDDPDEVDGPVLKNASPDGEIVVESSARVAPSVAIATDFVTKLGTPSLQRCLKAATVGDAGTLTGSTARVGDQALSLHATASQPDGSGLDAYVVTVRKGASVAIVTISSSGSQKPARPISADQAAGLARKVADRL